MKPINVELRGCDDSNYVCMLMTEQELEFLNRLAIRFNENSRSSCQPGLLVGVEMPEYDDEVDDE